jgi:HSP20 family protein
MFELIPFRRRNGKVESREDPFNYLWSNFFDMNDMGSIGFKTDVKETENEYILQAELPGMNRDNIKLEIEDNYLTISASNDEVVEEERDNYIRKERRSGSYRRSFNIENIKDNEIKANYREGILEVLLPKKEQGKVSKRVVDIE